MIPSTNLTLVTGLAEECDFHVVTQNSVFKKWRTFLLRLSHKSSVTSRRWPLYFLPGDATITHLFKTGSDDADCVSGLLLITVTTHVLPLSIHATLQHLPARPWCLRTAAEVNCKCAGMLLSKAFFRLLQKGCLLEDLIGDNKRSRDVWGVTAHRRKRTPQTLLCHWEMTPD